jgi:hypothetical protein
MRVSCFAQVNLSVHVCAKSWGLRVQSVLEASSLRKRLPKAVSSAILHEIVT